MGTYFVDCGTAWLTQLMKGTITSTTFYAGWGEGGTAVASKGSWRVSSEASPARNTAASSISAYNQMQWISVLTATAATSVNNAGLFATNSGPLLIHGDFATIGLAQNDRIELTITLTST